MITVILPDGNTIHIDQNTFYLLTGLVALLSGFLLAYMWSKML